MFASHLRIMTLKMLPQLLVLRNSLTLRLQALRQ
jgi:hypothetical protein